MVMMFFMVSFLWFLLDNSIGWGNNNRWWSNNWFDWGSCESNWSFFDLNNWSDYRSYSLWCFNWFGGCNNSLFSWCYWCWCSDWLDWSNNWFNLSNNWLDCLSWLSSFFLWFNLCINLFNSKISLNFVESIMDCFSIFSCDFLIFRVQIWRININCKFTVKVNNWFGIQCSINQFLCHLISLSFSLRFATSTFCFLLVFFQFVCFGRRFINSLSKNVNSGLFLCKFTFGFFDALFHESVTFIIGEIFLGFCLNKRWILFFVRVFLQLNSRNMS